MSVTRAWIEYSLVRLGSFALPFAAVMLILPDWQWNWVLGAVVGALVSAAVAEIALRKHVTVIAKSIAERRERGADRDQRRPIDIEEDAELDAQEAAAKAAASDAVTTESTETAIEEATASEDDPEASK